MQLLNTYEGKGNVIAWLYQPKRYHMYRGSIRQCTYPKSISGWVAVNEYTLIPPQSTSTRS